MYSDDDLDLIFAPRCHLCGGPVRRSHYGRLDTRLAWEVDHNDPLALGGGDEIDNLFPAHPWCNRAKGSKTSDEFRATLNGGDPACSVTPHIASLSVGIGLAAALAETDPAKKWNTALKVGLGAAALLAVAEALGVHSGT